MTRTGTGSGTVTGAAAGIGCGAACNGAALSGSTIGLSATPDAGSAFMGWLGACTGKTTCNVVMNGAQSVSAGFAPSSVLPRIDIDGNGQYGGLTDGLLIFRYLLGLSGTQLTGNAIGTTPARSTPEEIAAHLGDLLPIFDVDGNGAADWATDGVLVIRYLMGLRGSALVAGALGTGARRSAAEIESYLLSLRP